MEPEQAHSQPILIYPFFIPKTKPIELYKIILSDDVVSKDNLQAITAKRDAMIQNLNSGDNMQMIIKSIEAYFPYVYALACSIENNPNLRLATPLGFSWTSSLRKSRHRTGSRKMHICFGYNYELIMVLMTYGIAHWNRAAEFLGLPSEDNIKAAANQLRIAAGIFDHLTQIEIPRWYNAPPERALECTRYVAQTLQSICLAITQQMAISQALAGATSKLLVAKLTIEVSNLFSSAQASIKSSPDYKVVSKEFLTWLDLQVNLSKALHYKLLGQVSYDNGKVGEAVSFASLGIKHSNDLDKIFQKKVKTNNRLIKFENAIKQTKEDVEHRYRKFKLDNDHVSFQKEVDGKLLAVPDGRLMVKEIPFERPNPIFTDLY
eukprot:TRINITY_DN1153_c0_g1_i3.p1 TRINITY_DN1153_c0_g1~~TRINITY_DN1153_c0_g1_i3.p1  ORF type:complete len:377 (-),score=48.54 TRINITY_DN1153_c0_g1_i3:63-1193(-)